jgi:hypothetical protein
MSVAGCFNTEVALIIEQGLILMLVACLTAASVPPDQTPSRQNHDQVRGGIGASSERAWAHDRTVRADWDD